MSNLAEFLHYLTVALVVAINSLGVGIGEGITSSAALDAINTQPTARNDITRIAILGMALIETAAIMGITIAIMLILSTSDITQSVYASIASLGVAAAICLPGFAIGLVSAFPAKEACFAVARQPFFAQRILRFMLITQSIIQTPIIFGFIIAMFIKNQALVATSLPDSIRLVASGLSIGVGSIGPAIGLAQFAKTACRGLGINRESFGQLLSFTFISEAIIETPIIFALVISLLLIVSNIEPDNILKSIALLSAACCIGMGTLGAGISSGRTASAACHQIALHPKQHATLSKISMFSQGLIDTCAIYALLISLLLILK